MKICWLSDFDIRGSGYRNISVPLCNGLVKLGHEVKASAFGYQGQEHNELFSLLPAKNLRETAAITQNLFNLWHFDIFVMAMDIPIQEQILAHMTNRPFKYVGLFAIEADPLCQSWAMVLMQMDKRFMISRFGVDEAKKVGVDGINIEVGIDTSAWKQATKDEKIQLRKSLGIPEDAFVVLTVADNQERKHLSAGIEIVSKFHKEVPEANTYYLMVTREHNMVGWKLRDLAQTFGISDRLLIYERGMSHKQLWSMYAMSDVFFLPSKAEGLGMPMLEAMAVGIPCMATDCTGMHELLYPDRGILVPHAYSYIDPFGNGNRYLIDKDLAVECMKAVYFSYYWKNNPEDNLVSNIVKNARKFVEKRTWEKSVNIFNDGLRSMFES